MKKITGASFHRRRLPHWQEPGSIYFITWNCKPGLFLDSRARSCVFDSVRFYHYKKYWLFVALIMPDHVHLLLQPHLLSGSSPSLSYLIKSLKGYTARVVNLYYQRRGALWQREYYDRIIRTETEFLEKWQYIRNNPVKAGLSATPEEYPWLWEAPNLQADYFS